MTRRRKALIAASAAVALTAGGVAYGVNLRLPGRGTASTLVLAWDQAIAPVSSDPSDTNDPAGPGVPAPSTEAYNLAELSLSYSGEDLVASVGGAYDGYRVSFEATSKATPGTLKVQQITITDDSANVPGSTPFVVGTNIQTYIEPGSCGKMLNAASDKKVRGELRFPDVDQTTARTYAFKLRVDLVPLGLFAAGDCRLWTAP